MTGVPKLVSARGADLIRFLRRALGVPLTLPLLTGLVFRGAFQNHGWLWGNEFCDTMHFQYATGY